MIMSLNPLNELKRRLTDEKTPLPKRMCLAKNVVYSHHFPTTSKERIIGEWLLEITKNNLLSSQDIQGVLQWFDVVDVTEELKLNLIKIVSQYIQNNPLQNNDIQYIVTFLENDKILTQLNHQVDHYLTITITLLKCLGCDEEIHVILCKKIFTNMIKYYKECKKKLEFITKVLNMENIETVFSFVHSEIRENVIEFCRNILFPVNKKSFFISYLQTLIRKDNIKELIAEKGDNIQSVLKIMNTFFDYSKQNEKDPKFIKDFIDAFVSCLHNESQIIFAFYIMVTNFLNMQQKYITPAVDIKVLMFGDNDVKLKRALFLNMLEILLRNEVDISVRLTDTFGEKLSKVETKKTFITFLQTVMMGQLKLEGKLDKNTLQIIKTASKLDPILIEQKITEILPPIMSMKKNTSNNECYIEMLNCLLATLFKLSRGSQFISKILPFIKTCLEASNNEQFELQQKLKDGLEAGLDCEKLKNKIITGKDIFPDECVEMYGRLTYDLMFRQNKQVLESFQKDFEEHFLLMLEEGFISPSVITLAEILSAILSSFLCYNKMADHTVPQQIADDYWSFYQNFEDNCLSKYGECVLKLNYNIPLVLSFLKLCQNFAQLKLINMKYSNVKLYISQKIDTLEVFDLNFILPCLTSKQWITLASKVTEDEGLLALNNLLIIKTMALELLIIKETSESLQETLKMTKNRLIKYISTKNEMVQSNISYSTVFQNLDKKQYKQMAKSLVKMYLENGSFKIVEFEKTNENLLLLNALVLETIKTIMKCFENSEILIKSLTKIDFDIRSFVKDIDTKDYFCQLILKENVQDTIKLCVDLIKKLKVPYIQENYQLVVIFTLLAIKKCCQSKKIRRNVDQVLQSVYELSVQPPDLYKLFRVDYIFCFEDKTIMDLLILTIKTSNNLLIIKCILETAVRRVKTNSEIVKNIVGIILNKKQINVLNLNAFNNPVFQITCIILPLIVKQKKAITASAFRSILADLQEKLQKELLESFKNIDFTQTSNLNNTGDTNDSIVEFGSDIATLNAMAAYSLTLSRYCETTDVDEIKNLDCLWSGLEYFVKNAVDTIQNASSKSQHIQSSLKLLIIILRYIKKLDTHRIFQEKDKLFVNIWQSVKSRLFLIHTDKENVGFNGLFEDISILLKFLCELTPLECFAGSFVGDLATLNVLEKPTAIIKDQTDSNLMSYKVSNHLWTECLKSNIIGPKCVALSKLMYRSTKNLRYWLRQYYDADSVAIKKRKRVDLYRENDIKVINVDDKVCNFIKLHLDTLSEVIFAAKKISLDYKFLDCIFSLQHMVQYILGGIGIQVKCEITHTAYFQLFGGCFKVLNSLLLSREEVLEDRWPNYMQCYRALVISLCEKSSSHVDIEKNIEDKLAEAAHNMEKLTQSISKRKKQVSRIAAYTVGDICIMLEQTSPARSVRTHLENCVSLLIQASDSTYSMAFLKRTLAGTAGQITMTNLYTMYKRYHKYVGNA